LKKFVVVPLTQESMISVMYTTCGHQHLASWVTMSMQMDILPNLETLQLRASCQRDASQTLIQLMSGAVPIRWQFQIGMNAIARDVRVLVTVTRQEAFAQTQSEVTSADAPENISLLVSMVVRVYSLVLLE